MHHICEAGGICVRVADFISRRWGSGKVVQIVLGLDGCSEDKSDAAVIYVEVPRRITQFNMGFVRRDGVGDETYERDGGMCATR